MNEYVAMGLVGIVAVILLIAGIRWLRGPSLRQTSDDVSDIATLGGVMGASQTGPVVEAVVVEETALHSSNRPV